MAKMLKLGAARLPEAGAAPSYAPLYTDQPGQESTPPEGGGGSQPQPPYQTAADAYRAQQVYYDPNAPQPQPQPTTYPTSNDGSTRTPTTGPTLPPPPQTPASQPLPSPTPTATIECPAGTYWDASRAMCAPAQAWPNPGAGGEMPQPYSMPANQTIIFGRVMPKWIVWLGSAGVGLGLLALIVLAMRRGARP